MKKNSKYNCLLKDIPLSKISRMGCLLLFFGIKYPKKDHPFKYNSQYNQAGGGYG
jgi:hypothetical protein